MTGKAVASALRVLAVAAERDLVASGPKELLVYARTLEPVERQWLVDGMDSTRVDGYDVVGYLVGRVVRIQLTGSQITALLAPAGAR